MASPGGIEVARISTRVVADTSHMFEELKADLAKIEAASVLNISTSIDTAALDAQAKAAVAQAQVAAGDINLKTNVDSSQVAEATSLFSRLTSSLSAGASAASVLGLALIPVVAVVGTLAAALAGPALLAGAGATLYGFITGAAIKQTEAANEKIIALKKTVDSAKQSLANATASAATSASNSLASASASATASIKAAQQSAASATTAAGQAAAAQRIQAARASLAARQSSIQAGQSASIAAAQRRVSDAVLAYQAALDGLTPSQERFLRAQDAVKNAFHELLANVGTAVLGPVTKAMRLLATLLPTISPILTSFAAVFNGFLKDAGDAAKGKGFHDLIHLIATTGAKSFKQFAQIIGNLVVAFGHLGKAFLPFGSSTLAGLDRATKRFADFTGSVKATKGVREFIGYVKQNLPNVGTLLGNVFGLLATAFGDLAPAGTAVLDALTGVTNEIRRMGVVAGPLTALLVGIFAPFVGGPELGIVLGLAAAFKELYDRSRPLRRVVGDLGDFFKRQLLPIIKNAAEKIVPAFNAAIHDISKTIKDNRQFLELLGKLILVAFSAVVVGAIYAVVAAIRAVGLAFKYGVPLVKLLADVTLAFVQVGIRAFGEFVKVVLQVLGAIVDASSFAFGWIPGIGGHLKDAQKSFHDFADGVNSSFTGALTNVTNLRTAIHNLDQTHPKFTVDSNTLTQIHNLHELQSLRINDKSFNVVAKFQQIELAPGPGGGINHPAANNAGGAAPRTAPPTIHVDKVVTPDPGAFLRWSNKRSRAQSGGGVLLGVS